MDISFYFFGVRFRKDFCDKLGFQILPEKRVYKMPMEFLNAICFCVQSSKSWTIFRFFCAWYLQTLTFYKVLYE